MTGETNVSKINRVESEDNSEKSTSGDSTSAAPQEVGYDIEDIEENDSETEETETVDTMTPAEAIFSQNNGTHTVNSVKVISLSLIFLQL